MSMTILYSQFSNLKTFAYIISLFFVAISMILVMKSFHIMMCFHRRDKTWKKQQKKVMIVFICNLLAFIGYNLTGSFLFNNLHLLFQDFSLLISFASFYGSMLSLMQERKSWKQIKKFSYLLAFVYLGDCALRFVYKEQGYCKNDWLNSFQIVKCILALIFGFMGLANTNRSIRTIEGHMEIEKIVNTQGIDHGKDPLTTSFNVKRLSGMNVKFLVEQIFFVKLALIIFLISLLANIVEKVIIFVGVHQQKLQSCTIFLSLASGPQLTFFDRERDRSFFAVCQISFFYLQKIFDVYLPITLILWIYQQTLNASTPKLARPNHQDFKADDNLNQKAVNYNFSRAEPEKGTKNNVLY